jgi:hypothetical protein
MGKRIEYMGDWFAIRAPYISITILLLLFAAYGSTALPNDNGFQVTALLIVILQVASMVFPQQKQLVMVTDLSTIFWLAVIGWIIYTELYPLKAGPFAVMETPTLAIFVAFCVPLRARVSNRKRERYLSHSSYPMKSRVF